MDQLARFSPQILSILRIMTALLLLQHGLVKFFGFPIAPGGGAFPPAMFSMYWFAGLLELVGGALLLVGFMSRWVAFILSGELAFAYFIGHAPGGFYPIGNRGEAAILFCFIFLYIAAAGPGPWSVDAARSKA